jgi:hypothetical protein
VFLLSCSLTDRATDTTYGVDIPWSDLSNELVEDAIECAADKGHPGKPRKALETGRQGPRAAELVDTEVIPLTRQIVKDLTYPASIGNLAPASSGDGL